MPAFNNNVIFNAKHTKVSDYLMLLRFAKAFYSAKFTKIFKSYQIVDNHINYQTSLRLEI